MLWSSIATPTNSAIQEGFVKYVTRGVTGDVIVLTGRLFLSLRQVSRRVSFEADKAASSRSGFRTSNGLIDFSNLPKALPVDIY